jgi:hypothetical protein
MQKTFEDGRMSAMSFEKGNSRERERKKEMVWEGGRKGET